MGPRESPRPNCISIGSAVFAAHGCVQQTDTQTDGHAEHGACDKAELSMGWVDPWVGLGWVEIFQFLVGWVHCSKSTKKLKGLR